MRIIIADDHARFRALLRSLLADVASEVIECLNGAQAVGACQKERPDWLLIDIRMPVMDGLEAIRVVKASEPATRVIVVTNHGDLVFREQAAALGVEQFVLKENLGELRNFLRMRLQPPEAAP